MRVELKLLEQFKLKTGVSANFVCNYSEDDRLFIICDTGIYIIALKGYPACPFPTLSCKKNFLKVSNFLPSANIDLDINTFHKNLERFDLYEVTMSTEYSANLSNTIPIEPKALSVQWSPKGLVGKTECMLGVLTTCYSLEVYVKYSDENDLSSYCMVCNVTQGIIDAEKIKWTIDDTSSVTIKLIELKKRIGIVTPTAFTWSHLLKINNQEACALCVGHMNGDITVWKINVRPNNSAEKSRPFFLGRYSTHLKKITTMYWHRTTEFGGGLCFADSDGKMSILHVSKLDQEDVTIDNELAFWTEADKVLVDKITVITYDNRTYILVVKQSYLIIYALTETGDVFDQKVCDVGHYYITGIYHFDNVILVLTMPGVFKQYTILVENGRVLLKEKIIPLKMDLARYRTHGFFFSNNRVLFGLIVHPCHLSTFRKIKTFTNFFLCHNSCLNPFEILWYNESESIRSYWDCIEVLRLICIKDKRFPWLGLPPDLNYDNLSVVQLKTLRVVAKLSEMVFNLVSIIKSYDIKPYIIIHYLVEIKLIVKRINNLLNLRNSGIHLSAFQMRSIDIQNFFLKEMVVKNILAKANVGKNFINDIRHVMSIANELKYPPMIQCIWCGEKIIGPLCLPPHADSRCSISMMPIALMPAYKCPFCKALAHEEIEKEQDVIFCPYCDIPMEKRVINKETCQEFARYNVHAADCNTSYEELKSVCFDDCLKDDINFSDIEENTNDYVIFSDSEEECGEEGREFRTMYAQLAGMSLEEIIRWEGDGGGQEEGDKSDLEAGPSSKVIKLEEESL